MIRIDRASHTYWDGETRIMGVSEVLKKAGAAKAYYGKDTKARDRGTDIHLATELMDTIGMSPLDYPEEIYPYLRAWEQFQEDTDVKILKVEELLYNQPLGYAGTMDRLGDYGGLIVLDIKTGSAAPWHREQIAAYAMAWEAQTGQVVEQGAAVYLKATGKYSITRWADIAFSAAKTTFTSYVRKIKEQADE